MTAHFAPARSYDTQESPMPNHPSVIARPTADGFAGRYIHSDGHPDRRVPLLRALYNGPFYGDLDEMIEYLVDRHPAGWSQIGYEIGTDTGWYGHGPGAGYDRPMCYCHGERNDDPLLCTSANTDRSNVDWVYVLRPDGIEILRAAPNGETWLPGRSEPWTPTARGEIT